MPRRRQPLSATGCLTAAAGGLFLLALLAAAVLETPRPVAPRHEGPPAAWAPPVTGMNINVYWAADMAPYRAAIDGIAALGCDTVQIVTPMFVENGESDEVQLIEGPDRGPTAAQLLDLMAHAKARGLRVHLMPQVNLYRPRGNEWRGKISPTSWPRWWASYRAGIHHFLGLAIEGRADLFVVGCELLSTQHPEHEPRWRSLIAECRAAFAGPLVYSTNWDRYDRVLFWDALDAIGISAYWDLTAGAADADRPTEVELLARWRSIRATLLAYAEAERRPVLLTEVGYPSLRTGLKQPWNYLPPDRSPDPATQAAGYRAFLEAWEDELAPPHAATRRDERVVGVCFYKWDIHTDGGRLDSRYGIAGKPAYDLVHAWLRR